MPKEVQDVQAARWEGFKRLARTLPDHQILAAELVRTLGDETIAVLTVVRDHAPVRYVITGDAEGRVKAQDHQWYAAEGERTAVSVMKSGKVPPGGADPAAVAVGDPPPHHPVPPGVLAVGCNLLGATFDVAERVDIT
jgi:hypothetical protein